MYCYVCIHWTKNNNDAPKNTKEEDEEEEEEIKEATTPKKEKWVWNVQWRKGGSIEEYIIDKNVVVVFSAFLFWLLNCDDLECVCMMGREREEEELIKI